MRRRRALRSPLMTVLAGGVGLTLAAAAAANAAAPSAPDGRRTPTGRPSAPVTDLRADIRELIGRYHWKDVRWGVLITSLDRGDTLFALHPDSALAPASNMKLLTSAAALAQLGPDYRFRTYLLGTGPVRGGALRGDLVLYGTGDPGISDRFFESRTEVFERLVDQLEGAGVRRIDGNLVADASYLAGPLHPEGWSPQDLNDAFAAPVSAVSFNENVVSFRVEATRPGRPPAVHTIPDHAGLPIRNEALTVAGRAHPRLGISRATLADPVLVDGRIRAGARDVWRQMTVPDPPRFALNELHAVLLRRGIAVTGSHRVVRRVTGSALGGGRVYAPAVAGKTTPTVLAAHTSPPMQTYLEVLNKKSHNLFAELIFRTLGRVRSGVGSPREGRAAVLSFLREHDIDTAGLRILDGSGLSKGNRVAPATFVQLIARMAALPLWNDFWATLPEAGNRRELRRMYRTATARNLRAKTGTIEDVSALSGMVHSVDGERLAFSVLVNGTPSTRRAKRIENRLGARLAEFTRESGDGGRTVGAHPRPGSAGH